MKKSIILSIMSFLTITLTGCISLNKNIEEEKLTHVCTASDNEDMNFTVNIYSKENSEDWSKIEMIILSVSEDNDETFTEEDKEEVAEDFGVSPDQVELNIDGKTAEIRVTYYSIDELKERYPIINSSKTEDAYDSIYNSGIFNSCDGNSVEIK